MSAVNSTPDDPQEQDSKFLIFEWPIALYPALARILGSVDDAIVLQQIRYWTEQPAMGKLYKGRRWVRNSIHQWCIDNFYFWSEDTVARILDRLRDLGVIDTEKLNTSKFDQTLWYAINFKRLNELADESGIQNWLNDRFLQKHGIDSAIPQNALPQEPEIHDRKSADSSIQTTSENTEDSLAKKPRVKKEKSPDVESPKLTTALKDTLAAICYGSNQTSQAWAGPITRSQMLRAFKTLFAYKPDLTADDLIAFKQRWDRNDWRGKEGRPPIPGQVAEQWLVLMAPPPAPDPTAIDWSKVDWDKIPSIPSNAAGGKRPEEWDIPSYDSTPLDHILDDDEEVPF